ncbi:hypothetical protein EE612_040314, partial [Oryza sativa]
RPDGPVHGGHRGPQPPRPATGRRRVRHLHGGRAKSHTSAISDISMVADRLLAHFSCSRRRFMPIATPPRWA